MNPTLELDFWLRLLGILALEISLIVALAFTAQAFTQSAFWRRAIWQSCFVCLLLLVASEVSGAGRGIAVWFAGKPVVERKVSVRILPVDESFVPAPIETEIPPPIEFSEKPAPVVRSVWWPGILWFAGLALIVARILFARILFLSLRWRKGEITDATLRNRVSELALNLGIRRKIHLLESPGFSSPMTFGIARPCIALPKNFAENFNPAQQNAMLTHELAHVAARDPFWYLLADIASALLWWHPLVWLARRRLHSASELAADEAAAILENGPGTLAECLVNLGQRMTQSRSFGWLGVDGNGFRSHLGQRVERLLNLKPTKKNKLRGWPLFVTKTAFTIFFGGLIVFTSGWIQNGKALREKDFTASVQKSWNGSFVSMTLAALAEEKANFFTKTQSKAAETPPPPAYEFVNFDSIFYDGISTEKLNFWSRTIMDAEDNDSITILSSNQLRRVLRTFSDLPHTYDFVGNKFSGGHFLYQGTITNGNACEWITKTENGIARVKGAQMTYASTNSWSFSFVPQKLESSIQINLEWPNDTNEFSRKIEVPFDGGAIVRRSLPDDPAQSELILFSSVRVLIKAEAEKAHIAAATLLHGGKLLFEMGKLDEAEAKLNEALKIDAENKAAFYYKSLIKEARLGRPRPRIELMRPTIPLTTLDKTVVETRQVPPSNSNPAPRTNLVYTSRGRQMIKAKLDRIRLKEVQFEDLPLGEVLKMLRTESKEQDPEHVGINFLFNPQPVGLSEPVDVNQIRIGINAPAKNFRLTDILNVLVHVANKPIEYKIEDYAVVFSPKSEAIALYARVYKLNAVKFLEELKRAFPEDTVAIDPQLVQGRNDNGALAIPRFTDPLLPRNFQASVNHVVREFFNTAGVAFVKDSPVRSAPNGKSVFFNDRTGLLLVRATSEDLEKIQKAIAPFAIEQPQVTVEAEFIEASEAALQKLGRDFFFRIGISVLTNQTASDFFLTGTNVTKDKLVAPENAEGSALPVAEILSGPQSRILLRALEKAGGVDILAAPKVTTLSGRQTQISIQDAHTVVNGPGLGRSVNTNIISTNGFWVENILTGPVLDVLPTVSADGFAIEMGLQATVTKFLGYDEGGHQTFKPTASSKPRARVRSITENVSVWDGQTVMLSQEDNNKSVRDRKYLFVFVTPTIIDPAGNRVHSDEDMPFTTNSIPKQPEQK
jgi:beta-lactamase regulating signal transducer with metallopeptidase domain